MDRPERIAVTITRLLGQGCFIGAETRLILSLVLFAFSCVRLVGHHCEPLLALVKWNIF
jgi:hypothetical protein